MRQNSANLPSMSISLEPNLSRKRNFDDIDDSDNNNDISSTLFKPFNRIKEKIHSLAHPKPSSSQHITIDLATDSGENEDVGESTTSLPEYHIKRKRCKQQRQDNDQETYEILDDSSDEEKCGRKRKANELSDNLLDEEISYKEKCRRQRKVAKLSDNLLDEVISFEEKRAYQMALNKEKCSRKRKADELSK
ncbi:hypothetical protein G6F43_011375 [Rhizopus delemar]|nr:hypothetical protein G6F43_011375 [Rhizopus delemar]